MSENRLTEFVMRGLDNCWMPEAGSWSYIYHLDGRAAPNESHETFDSFYSMNVLLSFAKLATPLKTYQGRSLQEVFEVNAEKIHSDATRDYAKGMLLWAAAENGFEMPGDLEDRTLRFIEAKLADGGLSAQAVGMMLTGCSQMIARDAARYRPLADRLYALLMERISCPSDLYFDDTKKQRRRFSSFATNTYSIIALFTYGAATGTEAAIDKALRSSKKIVSMQGPDGEWPWFFYTPGGRVVDFYEVYSVHQDGMAPAFLHLAEEHGFAGARAAIEKGFHWIFGQNQLGQSMLHPETGMITRSVVRKGELENSGRRVRRAVTNALLGRANRISGTEELELRLECRSYHLGWVVWSFANRDDYPELTGHDMLALPDLPLASTG